MHKSFLITIVQELLKSCNISHSIAATAKILNCLKTQQQTTTILRPFVWDYPGKPVPEETLTHPPSWSSSNLYELLPSTTIHSILHVQFHAWQYVCTTSFHVLFGLPLGLKPSTSYSIHFFTQSVSSFRSTCPHHHNLFCCNINIISSIPSLSLNPLLGTLSFTLTLHIHLTIFISARWSATSFSFLTGQVSLLCSILLCTQLLYSLPLLILSLIHIWRCRRSTLCRSRWSPYH